MPFLGHLKRSFLFGALPEKWLQRISLQARLHKIERDTVVFQKGDPPTGVYLVLEGTLKEACQSATGCERIIEILGPQQTCGESAWLLAAPYPFSLTSITRSRLVHIEGRLIDELIASDAGFVNRLAGQLSQRLHVLVEDVEQVTTRSPIARISGYLMALTGASPDHPRVSLPYPKAMIASRLGMTPEALSRGLRDLQEARLIRVAGGEIELLSLQHLKHLEKSVQ